MYLLVLEEGFLLNIPVILSFMLFFSRLLSVSISRLKSDPVGSTVTLGINAFFFKYKIEQNYLKTNV